MNEPDLPDATDPPPLPAGVQAMLIGSSVVLLLAALTLGISIRPSAAFGIAVTPFALAAWLGLALRVQPGIVGCRVGRRRDSRAYGPWGAWALALAASLFAVATTVGVGAEIANRAIGHDATQDYEVLGKYVTHAKSTCYGLDLRSIGQPQDRLHLCVGPDTQAEAVVGRPMELTLCRSWIGEQVLSVQPANPTS